MQGLVLVALLVVALADLEEDPNACAQWPTCEQCLQHNLCGWCADPVVYEDRHANNIHCAGKPVDPNNPPPGFKKWTCPKDYQNKACYGYVCSNDTFQCVSSGFPGGGVPLDKCIASCFPPTYECNQTTFQCYQTVPGRGTDKPNCEKQCRNDLYVCTANQTCERQQGGAPKEDCLASCKPSNVTPTTVIGDYRGLQINKGYVSGEWQAKITETSVTLWGPDGSVYFKGTLQTFLSNQLWVVTEKGVRKGQYVVDILPEVQVLTWGLGDFGAPAPLDWDTAMKSGTTFVLAKCGNPAICKFNVKGYFADKLYEMKGHRDHLNFQDKKRQVNDPCQQYGDCQTCVDALNYCGWCSVPVVYEGGIVGKQCASINKTTTPPFNCSGVFSIEDCSTTSTGTGTGTGTSGTTSTSTGTGTGTGTGTSTGTSSTTGPPPVTYVCDPVTLKCNEGPGGQDKATCDAQCTLIPVVPPLLVNKDFRGLQINQNYMAGEWRAKFTDKNVSITAPGSQPKVAKVTSTGTFLTLHWTDGKQTQTLWQLQGAPASEFLSWAWGMLGGDGPKNYDEAMNTSGEQEFWFVACLPGKPTDVCQWRSS